MLVAAGFGLSLLFVDGWMVGLFVGWLSLFLLLFGVVVVIDNEAISDHQYVRV